ncbi:hypothetical protein D9611_014104 [Ephemerocybe angulata]|uniref:Major facilitator superfamily (MFS) profile domain-containing protein n=1 Tax=Ephemerocybe angulata TaxID=980116 RepID=A0A8H5B988_9AGAR|nr:hypothetical protein D9611_014104 [Tulosesus angulatus]
MARPPTGKELVEISEIEKADISQTPSPPSSPIASQLLTEIDPEAERRLVKKLDWIVLPLFTAICNAKVAGLETDLGMHGVDLNVALTVFYIFYVIADIPSNLILKRFGSAWLAFLVIGFGVISLASAFLHNYAGLLASRIFLGLTEGGTLYYRKEELVLRVGIFFGVGPSIAGACLITTIFGLVLLFIVPEDPSKSRLLSVQERKLAMARIDAGQIVKTQGLKEKTTPKLVLRSFNLIVGTVEVQLRTVPPYVASAVWVVINAWVSARLKKRFLPILYNIVLVIIGYAISVSTKHPQTRYAACFLMIMGGSVGGPMLVTWGTDNAAPDTMRAVVTAAIPGIGAFGAVMAVWTYAPSDAPDYRKGNLANLSACSAIFVIVSLTALYIAWENRKRARGERDHRLEGLSEKETMRLGYRHPRFRYQI